MGLRWTEGEASRDGFDDRGMLAASIVRYRSPIFRGGPVGWSDPYWVGHLVLMPLLGPDGRRLQFATAEEAQAAVDTEHEARAIADLDAGHDAFHR